MEKAIILQNPHWVKPYKNLFDRKILSKLIFQLSAKEIQVLLGIRRSGKSTIFKLLINHLLKTVSSKSILYINFDDPFFAEIIKSPQNVEKLLDLSEKITNEPVQYLFLDEIQSMPQWEKFVKSAYDNERFKKMFVTGSNSSLLNAEYARLLSGRYIADAVYPLSFDEYLSIENLSDRIERLKNKSSVLRILDSMMEYGGFPEIVKKKDDFLKREILLNYYESIILKDCIALGKIREVKTFQELTHYLITNATSLFSYHSAAKAVGGNENSAKEFIRILENSFLIQEVRKFSFSLQKQSKAKKKIYCADNGFLANVSFRFSQNRGKLFENLVYSELKKKNYEIFYFADKNECDFIVKKENKIKALQVTYELTDRNKNREINGLIEAMEKLQIENGTIISFDQEEEINGVKVVPFWKYFSS
ncbi:MAG: ATP-binding protein [Chlorobi bacterium]|nr:ATP-binding protein [Chlorobiota bacterium]